MHVQVVLVARLEVVVADTTVVAQASTPVVEAHHFLIPHS
jgi:hypothetical protein